MMLSSNYWVGAVNAESVSMLGGGGGLGAQNAIKFAA